MRLRKWDDLPNNMKNESVNKYYDTLRKKRFSLFFKRIFDVTVATVMFIALLPAFLIIGIVIKIDSKGTIMFRQTRVTQYGKQFKIYKFRTMVNSVDKINTQVTTENDMRITKVGRTLRRYRLDEIPQLINIIIGDMTFVGTRPEVTQYVEQYTEEMLATLLLPAGVTSEASIEYKDEEKLLGNIEQANEVYIKKVLPEKMKYNLRSIEKFSFLSEIVTLIRTVKAVGSKGKTIDSGDL